MNKKAVKFSLFKKYKSLSAIGVSSLFLFTLSSCITINPQLGMIAPVGVVVSDSTSVLLDNSFSQNIYEGVQRFMHQVYGEKPENDVNEIKKINEALKIDTSTPSSSSTSSSTSTPNTTSEKANDILVNLTTEQKLESIQNSSNEKTISNKVVWYGKSSKINYPTTSQTSLLTAQTSSIWQQPVDNTDGGRIQAYDRLVIGKTKVVVASGFTHVDPLERLYKNVTLKDFYENIGFVLVDSLVDNPNIASLLFRTDQSGFAAALALGLKLNRNADQFDLKNNKFLIGMFGGIPIPPVNQFMGGFQEGVEYFNKVIIPKWKTYATSNTNSKIIENLNELKELDLNWTGASGGLSSSNPTDWFSFSFAPGAGQILSQRMISAGVSAILPVAGPQTNDVVRVIKEQNSKTIVVGVDTPQEFDSAINTTGRVKIKDPYFNQEDNKIIQLSAVKNLGTSVYSILNAIALNSLYKKTDSVFNGFNGLGYLNLGNYKNLGTGVSLGGFSELLQLSKIFETQTSSSNNSATTQSMNVENLKQAFNDPAQVIKVYESFPVSNSDTTNKIFDKLKGELILHERFTYSTLVKSEQISKSPKIIPNFLEPQIQVNSTEMMKTMMVNDFWFEILKK